MPGKARGAGRLLPATPSRAAVEVFGRGQVSTYLIAGLGDSPDALVAMAETLLALGVYPFVVPFVPHRGHAARGAAGARRRR